ncbi:hypothetical protein STVIR_1436 [Streptomyces viridochromogenes Tue57]|uniref:Uncharacterized protein n=1 Tax=Streptomyces viridochromogenes Tue57 TaxID=1160705 RepID=L8PM45_STRVR|nr:hypothetical protein STVIR_1436 [Streptomyces viridochromogenes Tue57]
MGYDSVNGFVICGSCERPRAWLVDVKTMFI